MAKETFDAIRAEFAQLLEDKFMTQESMVGQLNNYPSMRERLLELSNEHAELLHEITDPLTLVKDATKNRNVFSHGGKAAVTSSRAEEILWSGERQRFLFYAILLLEFGFSKADAYHLLRRHRTFERLTLLRE